MGLSIYQSAEDCRKDIVLFQNNFRIPCRVSDNDRKKRNDITLDNRVDTAYCLCRSWSEPFVRDVFNTHLFEHGFSKDEFERAIKINAIVIALFAFDDIKQLSESSRSNVNEKLKKFKDTLEIVRKTGTQSNNSYQDRSRLWASFRLYCENLLKTRQYGKEVCSNTIERLKAFYTTEMSFHGKVVAMLFREFNSGMIGNKKEAEKQKDEINRVLGPFITLSTYPYTFYPEYFAGEKDLAPFVNLIIRSFVLTLFLEYGEDVCKYRECLEKYILANSSDFQIILDENQPKNIDLYIPQNTPPDCQINFIEAVLSFAEESDYFRIMGSYLGALYGITDADEYIRYMLAPSYQEYYLSLLSKNEDRIITERTGDGPGVIINEQGKVMISSDTDTFTRRNYMYPGTVRFEKGSYIVTFEFSQQEFWKFKNQFK